MTASDNNKRIAQNTIILYIRMFVTMLIGFFTSRVILQTLGETDYGIYNVVGGLVGALAVLNGAMAASTQRWITIALGKGDADYLKKVFGVGLTSQAIIAIGIFLLTETLGLFCLFNYVVIPDERYDAAFWTFQISALTMLISIINVPFYGAIIAHEKMGVFAVFSILDVLLKLLICYLLIISTFDHLLLYAILLFVVDVINFLLQQYFCHKKFVEARFRFIWDKDMYKEMVSLAFWSISSHVAYVGYSQGVTLLINLFFGPTMNAAAGIANQANNMIVRFSSNFQMALNPQITKYYAQDNLSEMHKLVIRSSKFSFYLMMLFAVPLFLEAHFLLGIWLVEIPEHAIGFLRGGMFVTLIMAISGPLNTSAMACGNLKKYQFVVNGILILICPALYMVYSMGAIPEFANIIVFIFMLLATISSTYLLGKMIGLNYRCYLKEVFLKAPLIMALSSVLPIVIYYYIPEGWFRLIFLSVISVCSSIFFIGLLGLTKGERYHVLGILREKYFSLVKCRSK